MHTIKSGCPALGLRALLRPNPKIWAEIFNSCGRRVCDYILDLMPGPSASWPHLKGDAQLLMQACRVSDPRKAQGLGGKI